MAEFSPQVIEPGNQDKNTRRKAKKRVAPPAFRPAEEGPAVKQSEHIPPSQELVEEHRRRMEALRHMAREQHSSFEKPSDQEDDEDESDNEQPAARKKKRPKPAAPTEESESATEEPEHDRLDDETAAVLEEAEPAAAEEQNLIAQERKAAQTDHDPAVDGYLDEVAAGSSPDTATSDIEEQYDLGETAQEADQYLLDPEIVALIEDIDRQLAEQGVDPEEVPQEKLEELAQDVLYNEPDNTVGLSGTSKPSTPNTSGISASSGLPSTPNIPSATPTPASAPTTPPGSIGPVPGMAPPGVPPSPGGGWGGGHGATPDSLSIAPNMQPGEGRAEKKNVRSKVLTASLLSGLIGYYFGTKHGRRKQESEMRPAQERLAKENKDLRDQVIAGERRIKSLRRIQAEQTVVSVEQPGAPPMQETTAPTLPQPESADITPEPEAPSISAPSAEAAMPAAVAASSRQESVPPQAPIAEHKPPEAAPVRSSPETSQPETLSEPALLDLAEGIRFEGVNAKQMYEQNRLDKESLRRVVTEFIRGGNAEKVLAAELGTNEVVRAQSPEFLQQQASGTNAVAGGSNASVVQAQVPPDHLLPAYDNQTDALQPEHLLPAQTEHLPSETSGLGLALVFGAILILAIILAFFLL